jgi:hypothetical protein
MCLERSGRWPGANTAGGLTSVSRGPASSPTTPSSGGCAGPTPGYSAIRTRMRRGRWCCWSPTAPRGYLRLSPDCARRTTCRRNPDTSCAWPITSSAAGRRFVKPLRYDHTDEVLPDFDLTDSHPSTAVEVWGSPVGRSMSSAGAQTGGGSTVSGARSCRCWSGTSTTRCRTSRAGSHAAARVSGEPRRGPRVQEWRESSSHEVLNRVRRAGVFSCRGAQGA